VYDAVTARFNKGAFAGAGEGEGGGAAAVLLLRGAGARKLAPQVAPLSCTGKERIFLVLLGRDEGLGCAPTTVGCADRVALRDEKV